MKYINGVKYMTTHAKDIILYAYIISLVTALLLIAKLLSENLVLSMLLAINLVVVYSLFRIRKKSNREPETCQTS